MTWTISSKIALAGAAALALALPAAAQAQLVTYMAGDDHAQNLTQLPNSAAAAASFDAATGGIARYDFESLAPAGLGWSAQGNIRDTEPVAGCEWRCGYNTTAGGQYYLSHSSGWMTFTFDNPINAFGVYVTGLQATLVGGASWVQFNDGTEQSFYLPPVEGGGGAFVGFTDVGRSFTSVSFQSRSDILGFDDLRFGFIGSPTNGAVPEPATWALMILGFGAIGGALRRRRQDGLRVRFASSHT